MLPSVPSVEYTVTEAELEALILEFDTWVHEKYACSGDTDTTIKLWYIFLKEKEAEGE